MIGKALIGATSAKSSPTTLTTAGTTSSNSNSITPPTHQAGDLMVFAYFGQNTFSSIPALTIPEDQTVVFNSTTTGNPSFPQYGSRVILAYKVPTSTNNSTISITSNARTIRILAFSVRPNTPITTVTTKDVFNQWYFSGTGTQTTTVSDNIKPYVYFAFQANWTNSRPTYSPYVVTEFESSANFGGGFLNVSTSTFPNSTQSITRSENSQLVMIGTTVFEVS
jgi:hypothetical protein